MDLKQILMELREDRRMLDEAIMALERFQFQLRRCGRPPKWLLEEAGIFKVFGERGKPKNSGSRRQGIKTEA